MCMEGQDETQTISPGECLGAVSMTRDATVWCRRCRNVEMRIHQSRYLSSSTWKCPECGADFNSLMLSKPKVAPA